MELVAQLVRVPGCGPGGRGFKSPRAPIFFFIISLPRSSRGLGRRPFTAVTRVQIPYAVHHSIPGFSKTWDFFCLPSAVICLSHSRILSNTTFNCESSASAVQIPYAVHHSIPGFSKTWDFFCLPSAVICLSHF